jgi:hypothetical protein
VKLPKNYEVKLSNFNEFYEVKENANRDIFEDRMNDIIEELVNMN